VRRQRPRAEPVRCCSANVASALLRVLPADEVTFNDLDIRAHHCALVELLPTKAGESHGGFWQHFWKTLSCSYTERVGQLRGEVMTTGDLYSDRQWHSTGMYTECVAPDGVDKELVMPLPAPPGIARRLVFFREPGPPSAMRNGTRPCCFSPTSPRRFACRAGVPPSSR